MTPSPPKARAVRSPDGPTEGGLHRGDWVGVDFSHLPSRQRSRALLPLLGIGLLAALAVVALRTELIKTRYAIASTMKVEEELLEEQRRLIVRKRQLRGPVGLAVLARERGFSPAERIVSLPDPMPDPDPMMRGLEAVNLPSVAAAPPNLEAEGVAP